MSPEPGTRAPCARCQSTPAPIAANNTAPALLRLALNPVGRLDLPSHLAESSSPLLSVCDRNMESRAATQYGRKHADSALCRNSATRSAINRGEIVAIIRQRHFPSGFAFSGFCRARTGTGVSLVFRAGYFREQLSRAIRSWARPVRFRKRHRNATPQSARTST